MYKGVFTVLSVFGAVVTFLPCVNADEITYSLATTYHPDGSSTGWVEFEVDNGVMLHWNAVMNLDPETSEWEANFHFIGLFTEDVDFEYLVFMDEQGRYQSGTTTFWEIKHEGELYYLFPELTFWWYMDSSFDLFRWLGHSDCFFMINDAIVGDAWVSTDIYPAGFGDPAAWWYVQATFQGIFTGEIGALPEPASIVMLLLGVLGPLRRSR
jgi:hypothetical protein